MPGIGNAIGIPFKKGAGISWSSYWTQLKLLFGDHIIGFWTLSEKTGTIVKDISGNLNNGTYEGIVSLNQTGFDSFSSVDFNSTGYINIFSSGLASVFNVDEGFISFWVRAKADEWASSDTYLCDFRSDANNSIRIVATNGFLYGSYTAGGTVKTIFVASPSGSRWVNIGFRWSKSEDSIKLYINGRYLSPVSAQTGLGLFTSPITSAYLFCDDSNNKNFIGLAQDVFLLDYAPSDADIFSIVNPSSITVFEGDSRTVGYFWTSIAAEEGSIGTSLFGYEKDAFNVPAVGGSTVANLATRAATINAMKITGGENILVVWCGANDGLTLTAQEIFDALEAYCWAAKSAGWTYIVLCTEIDAQSYMAWHNTIWPALNALISPNHPFADIIADLGADARLQDATDTTYFNADKVHLVEAGYNVVGDIVGTALHTLRTIDRSVIPYAPSDLAVTIVSGTQINLSWINNSTIQDGVKIQRSTDKINWTEIDVVGLATTYNNTGLTEQTHYYYMIKSYKGVNSSNYLSIIDDYTLPVACTGLTAVAASNTVINLSWTNHGTINCDGVKIYISTDNVNYTLKDTIAIGTTYAASGLDVDTLYYFKVAIYRGIYENALSGEAHDRTDFTYFKITVDTTKAGSANNIFVLPTTGAGYDCYIDWGDGGAEEHKTGTPGNISHTYAASGTYQLKISGTFPRIYFNNGGDKLKLMSIDNWGNIAWSAFTVAFYGCSNMEAAYSDIPVLTSCNSFWQAFLGCAKFNGSVANWDVSHSLYFNQSFSGCTIFNQPLTGWDTSAATDMNRMFEACTAFNQAVNHLVTTNVTNMYGMFYNCTNFNQAVSSWDTSKVTLMYWMFYGCSAFNQAVANFDTAIVTNFTEMFRNCSAFKQSLAAFDLASATNITGMLNGCNINATGTSTNYDDTLIAWAAADVPNSLTFHGGTSKYSDTGQTARTSLINDDLWTITSDGGHI